MATHSADASPVSAHTLTVLSSLPLSTIEPESATHITQSVCPLSSRVRWPEATEKVRTILSLQAVTSTSPAMATALTLLGCLSVCRLAPPSRDQRRAVMWLPVAMAVSLTATPHTMPVCSSSVAVTARSLSDHSLAVLSQEPLTSWSPWSATAYT